MTEKNKTKTSKKEVEELKIKKEKKPPKTPEEKREATKKYNQTKKEKLAMMTPEEREKVLEPAKRAREKYFNKMKKDEAFVIKNKECCKKYNANHKEIINERARIYSKKNYENNREEKLKKVKEYQQKKKV
jgi:hypothetical protein